MAPASTAFAKSPNVRYNPSMPMTNDQLATLAKQLVEIAAQKPIPLRVLGGVAIYLTCSSIETHPTLQRTFKDLDFVAAQKDFDALASLLAAQGLNLRTRARERLVFEQDGVEIEIIAPDYREDHRIDLTARLALSSPTLPLADLLLIKLQRVQFAEKDIQDSIALLLDHRVGRGEGEDQIDRAYIAKLAARQWGLFTTAYANSITLEKVLDKYLEPEEAQLVWRRIELLQEDMDRAPKSFGWMVNQFLKRPAEVPR
jgi:hypothetical protein